MDVAELKRELTQVDDLEYARILNRYLKDKRLQQVSPEWQHKYLALGHLANSVLSLDSTEVVDSNYLSKGITVASLALTHETMSPNLRQELSYLPPIELCRSLEHATQNFTINSNTAPSYLALYQEYPVFSAAVHIAELHAEEDKETQSTESNGLIVGCAYTGLALMHYIKTRELEAIPVMDS